MSDGAARVGGSCGPTWASLAHTGAAAMISPSAGALNSPDRRFSRAAVDRFQPGAVDRNQFTAKQIKLAAEQHELAENGFEGMAVVFTEIGDGLEVGSQPAQ
jgi:hypothetical protein